MEIDIMDWFIISVCILVVGFYVGWIARGVVIMSNLADNPERMIDLLTKIKEINEQEAITGQAGTEAIKVERQGTMIYLYTEAKDEFIAQGASLQEALAQAARRFPDRTFAGNISKEEATALGIVKE